MNKQLRLFIIMAAFISFEFCSHNGTAQNIADINLHFSPEHGFYNQSIQVSITPDTRAATIHYTLDGRVPELTADQGTFLYDGPIAVNKTSCIRAMLILSDGSISDVMTQTYIFLDDVVQQDYQATLDAGFPRRWGIVTPDYGMDPDVVNDPQYAPLIENSLLSIPTMSIVMDIDDLFGTNGIYTNSEAREEAWERPGSVEFIFPDKSEGFQINCGTRIHGGWFRQHAGTRKHSFRLLFKGKYGPTKLRYPLFGGNAVERFDTIVLRAGANDGYAWNEARLTEQYTRDEFGRLLHLATGNAAAHGILVHLYLNGIYWGLHNPVERPDDSFSASYYGGDKEMWDAINSGEITNGDDVAWNLLLSKCRRGLTSYESFMEIQGKNPDGTRNHDFPILIDILNYIDYMIIQMWGGNWDWPHKNYKMARDRSENSTGFKFYLWDYENTMGNNRSRSPIDKDKVTNLDTRGVGEPHSHLLRNVEYRMLFADRIHRFFFNDGILTPPYLIDLYTELTSKVELSIIAESARWGDQHYSTPLTQKEWFDERDWIINEYLPNRSDIVLDQFRQANLYPTVNAPAFYVNNSLKHGGIITSSDEVSIISLDGNVYYTLDGTDPRLPLMSSEGGIVLISEDHTKHVIVPQDRISSIWRTSESFDDSAWLTSIGRPGGVGYDRSTGYEDFITLDIEDEMYTINASSYIRIPFNVDSEILDSLTVLTLKVRYDDGFIAYLNGSEVTRRNFTGIPRWNSTADTNHPDESAIGFEYISLSDYTTLLNDGGNLLAIQGLNTSVNSSDFLISVELVGEKRSHGPSISPKAVEYVSPFTLSTTTQIKSRVKKAGEWSALSEATFIVPSDLDGLVISELHYHPLPQDSIDDREFEFIELYNNSTEILNLSLARFVRGINYVFPVNTLIQPDKYIVLASNRESFHLRYGIFPFDTYSGQLDNAGERIILVNAAGDTIISFRYDDDNPWPEAADGDGYSLVFDNPVGVFDYNNPVHWRVSRRIHGSPGSINVPVEENQKSTLPKEFALLQNYPNPFNSSTAISFILPSKSSILLKVFDMMGREVATLVNEELAAGNHYRLWTASNISSGVYFYRLQTGSFVKTKKLVLLR